MLWIERELCAGCGRCVEACDVQGAISLVEDKALIDPSKCVSCGRCLEVCPRGAIQDAAAVEQPQQIFPVAVYPNEVPAGRQDTLARALSQTAQAPQRVPAAPKAQRWMAVASTAFGAAATLGEALLNRWLEGSRGGSGRGSRAQGGRGHRRQRRKGLDGR